METLGTVAKQKSPEVCMALSSSEGRALCEIGQFESIA